MSGIGLTLDSQVIVLLCSRLALPKDSDELHKPLGLSEWNKLANAIRESPWSRPEALLGKSAAELCDVLGVEPHLADRLTALLERAGPLAFELDRLTSRGIWILTRADDAYPARVKRRLGPRAPAVLFGAGPIELLASKGVAIVGSRDANAESETFAQQLAQRCAVDDIVVVSGGARGIDQIAMRGAVDAGGRALGVLADSLERAIKERSTRELIEEERLLLITPFHPNAGFNVGNAMDRNKLVYSLADYAVVVASSENGGGTRAGACEDLKHGWVPLFVRVGEGAPAGNAALLELGACPIENRVLDATPSLLEWLRDHSEARSQSDRGTPSLDGQAEPFNRDRSSALLRLQESTEPPGDLFPVVWPHLAHYLADWRSDRDVSKAFRLELKQAKAWLEQAVTERLAETVVKKGRTTKYSRRATVDYSIPSNGAPGRQTLPTRAREADDDERSLARQAPLF